MAEITIEVPDEIAEAIQAVGMLSADAIEMRDLIAWNIRTRADELVGWAERSAVKWTDHAAEGRRLTSELDALAGAYALFMDAEVKV